MLLQAHPDGHQTPLAAAVQAAQGSNPTDAVTQALTQEVSLSMGISLAQFGRIRLAVWVDMCRLKA